MGLLDHKEVQQYIKETISLKDLHQILNERLGKTYKVKYIDKKNMALQLMGASKDDALLIEKNAYHRTYIHTEFISQQQGASTDETIVMFNTATLKGWLKVVHNNFGFIGAIIIRLIYGSNEAFDKDILDAIKSSYQLHEREVNIGLSAMWKKDTIKEKSNEPA